MIRAFTMRQWDKREWEFLKHKRVEGVAVVVIMIRALTIPRIQRND